MLLVPALKLYAHHSTGVEDDLPPQIGPNAVFSVRGRHTF